MSSDRPTKSSYSPITAKMSNETNETFFQKGSATEDQGFPEPLDHASQPNDQTVRPSEDQQASTSHGDYTFNSYSQQQQQSLSTAQTSQSSVGFYYSNPGAPLAPVNDQYFSKYQGFNNQNFDSLYQRLPPIDPALMQSTCPAAGDQMVPQRMEASMSQRSSQLPSTAPSVGRFGENPSQTKKPVASSSAITEYRIPDHLTQAPGAFDSAVDPYPDSLYPLGPLDDLVDTEVYSPTTLPTFASSGAHQGMQTDIAYNETVDRDRFNLNLSALRHYTASAQATNLAAGYSSFNNTHAGNNNAVPHPPAPQASQTSMPQSGVATKVNKGIKQDGRGMSGRASAGRRGNEKPKTYKPEEATILKDMYNAGQSVADIASCLDRPVLGVEHKIRRMKKRHELPPAPANV